MLRWRDACARDDCTACGYREDRNEEKNWKCETEGMLEVGDCPDGDGRGGIERWSWESWAGGCVAAGRLDTQCMGDWLVELIRRRQLGW